MNIVQPIFTYEQSLQSEINSLINSKIAINKNYDSQITKVISDYNTNQITLDEKNNKIAQLNTSRINELSNVDGEVQTLQTQQNNVTKDPYKKASNYLNNLNSGINSSVKDVTGYRNKLKLELSSKVAGNATKSLLPVIALRISSQLSTVGSQNKKIEELIDNTNDFIENIKTQDDVNQAIVLRSGAINAINSNEQQLLSLKGTFSEISTFINIFNIVVSTLSALPIPLGAPLGVGVPMNIVLKVVKSIESANKLVLGLNTILGICISILSRMINDLEIQKSRLDEINNILDQTATSQLNNDDLQSLLSSITNNNSSDLGSYKGFTFVLKEESNPHFVVDGFKRHYAVALDSDGVIVLKSEYSFTLDPQVLVSQLKLQIDSKNMTP